MFALKKSHEKLYKENGVCIVRRSMLQTLLRWELPTSIHIVWFNYHMFIHLDNIGSSHISRLPFLNCLDPAVFSRKLQWALEPALVAHHVRKGEAMWGAHLTLVSWSDRGFGPPGCMMINQWTSVMAHKIWNDEITTDAGKRITREILWASRPMWRGPSMK